MFESKKTKALVKLAKQGCSKNIFYSICIGVTN